MHNDDNRKRKAAQPPSTSSKKHKPDSPTTSSVTLDAPARPTTRSSSKLKAASAAALHLTHRRNPSPDPLTSSQPSPSGLRTRSQTGSLKSKKLHHSLSEDHTPLPPIGLSQLVVEMQRQKSREIPTVSPKTSNPTKKRSKASSKPPRPEDVIVLSSDEGEDLRPHKRTRRHTTQVSEIVDLSKDENPPPKPRPKSHVQPKATPLPTPTSVANPTMPSSPPKYLDLRRFSLSNSKSKTSPSHSQASSPWPLKEKLPAAPLPTEMRRKRVNDKFADDDERGSPAASLPAVEVVVSRRKPTPTVTPKTRHKPSPVPKVEPEPEQNLSSPPAAVTESTFDGSKEGQLQGGRVYLSKELRARLKEEEEEEEISPSSSSFPTDSTASTIEDTNVEGSTAMPVVKTEDVEDTYISSQTSILNLEEEEESLVAKEDTRIVARSPSADPVFPIWADEQEQNDLDEAIFQSMLVASAVEAGAPPTNQEEEGEGAIQGDVEDQVDFSTMPAVSPSSASVDDAPDIQGPAQPESHIVTDEAEKVLEDKVEGKILTDGPLASTPPPATDFDSYLIFDLEQQEQNDLEEALFQSQLAIVCSPGADALISRWGDEDKSGVDENQGQVQEQVDAVVLSTSTTTSNPYEEDVFVVEDPDDSAPTTNETIAIPVIADENVAQPPSNEGPENKDVEEDEIASLGKVLFPEFSAALPQVVTPCPFAGSAPTTTFADLLSTRSTDNVFIAGQLTQRFFAQSCLPPKARLRATKLVEVVGDSELQVAKPVVEVLVQDAVEETPMEKPLVEVPVQSMVEEVEVETPVVEVPVQSEHDEVQSPAAEDQMTRLVEELRVLSGQPQRAFMLDADVPGVEEVLECEDVEVEMATVEAEVEIQREQRSEDEDGQKQGDAVVSISSPAKVNEDFDAEMGSFPEQDYEASASPASDTLVTAPLSASSDGDDDFGAAREVLVPTDIAFARAGEDDVVVGVAQEAEDGIPQVETASVSSPSASQTVEDIDMIEPTLTPEFGAISSEQTQVLGVEVTAVKVKPLTPEALEKDPNLSQVMHGSRVLLEIIRGIVESKPELEVASPTVQGEEADDGVVPSPLPQMWTPEPEALSLIQDHDAPSLSDGDSQLGGLKDTDDDLLQWSQVSQHSRSEPLAEIKDSGDALSYHKVPSSPRDRASTPDQVEHPIIVPSGPLEVSPSSHPRTPNNASVPPIHPFEASPSPCLQAPTLEPPVLGDDAGEVDTTGGPLEPELEDEGVQLPPTPVSIHNSPTPNLNYLLIDDEPFAQQDSSKPPCVQSIVSTGNIPSPLPLDPHRRTISNTGSESSLATSDDSPPPSTPPQSAFEAYYIRSTSPDDDLGPDIYSKLMDIPPLPLYESDEADEVYLRSLTLSYPDVDIDG